MLVFEKKAPPIALIGVLVPRRLQEWEAELRCREAKLVRVGQARLTEQT